MDPIKLNSNYELLEYLNYLSEQLKDRGQNTLAEDVINATFFATGSASEFLHEAQEVLLKITNTRPTALPIEILQEIELVIIQIKESFRRIGGA
jgi:hypothetical protein